MLAAELQHLFPGTPKSIGHSLPELRLLPGLRDGSVVSGLVERLAAYLEDRQALGYRTLGVGLSGGVDSAVACELAHRAAFDDAWAVTVDLGDESIEATSAIAQAIGIRHTVLDGREAHSAMMNVVQPTDVLARIHLRSRLVALLVHQYADTRCGLVVDTTDRSERVLRLYEEGRRGHVAPLIDLYKSEVYAAAETMDIPDFDERTSGCPELNNLDAFGLPWLALDAVLHNLDVEGSTAESISARTGLDRAWLDRLERRIREQPLRTDTVHLILGDTGTATRG
jgi:NH3-dependent NAD+ synthetase